MRKITRSIGLVFATAGTVAGLTLANAAAAEAANKALMVNGLGAGDLSPAAMGLLLGGMFSTYDRQNVSWPAQARPVTGKDSKTLTESVKIGADNLDAAITSSLAQLKPGEYITVVGLSAGALVVDEEMKRLAAKATAPDKSKINFVVVADSSRTLFNKNRFDPTVSYQYSLPAETKYNTTVVTGQYDGYADFPDKKPRVTDPKFKDYMTYAVPNAIAGSQLIHIPSMLTNLNTVPKNWVTTTTNAKGGVTTSYLVPSTTLPLVSLNPKLKPQEAQLRKIIDSFYTRPTPAVAAPAPAPAPAAAVPSAPAAPAAAAADSPAAAPAAAATPVRRSAFGKAAAARAAAAAKLSKPSAD